MTFNKNIKIIMKLLIISLISLVLVLFSAKLYPIKEVKNDETLEAFTNHLNQRIPLIMNDYNIPGVNIALIKNSEIIWLNSYGYADVEKKRKMTIDTYCRVESISKPVTAWGIMKLIEHEIIELDKPVINYLKKWEFPETRFSEEKITTRLLLSNTSGLPLGTIGKEALYSTDDQLPLLTKLLTDEAILKQEPGNSYLYSDTGFNLLELIIEEVTDKDFNEYMKEEVMLPLGMNNSSYTWNKEWKPEVPNGYDVNNNTISVYTYAMKGSGNLYSTVEDIAKFIIAGMKDTIKDHNVLNLDSINKLYTPIIKPGIYSLVFDYYGLGYFIEELSNGLIAVSHGGQGTGWMSHFHTVPDTGDGIVIITNSQRSWPFFSYILSDWSEWIGISKVKMEKIIFGQKVIWFLILMILFILIWQIYQLIEDLLIGKRKFRLFIKEALNISIYQIIILTILIFITIWEKTKEYSFLSSVFPIAYNWLIYLLILLALMIFLLIIFPKFNKK